jgi:uncharacterized protein YjbI with pentapeptide repeats
MADPKALEILKQSVQLWNENWNSLNRDLSGADLHDRDLTEARFEATNLAGANLEGCNLSGAVFGGANLCNTRLRDANLRDCDLSGVKGGLQQQQLGGADLTGVKLPDPLSKLFESLDTVKDISENARELFIAMLVACVYSWLTIATTTDANLITNRASSPLPIIQTGIPIVGFFAVAPLLLLCVYFYFHFYLQKLWEELGSLPAIFPDGRRLHETSDPWLLTDVVRSHVLLLRTGRPFMSYFQQAISILLAWWVVPVTLLLFWERYLRRHDFYWTAWQAVLLAFSSTVAVLLYRLAGATLRAAERQPFSWRGALKSSRGYGAVGAFLATCAAFLLVSAGAIWGVPPGRQDWRSENTGGALAWVPRVMALAGQPCSPFANLRFADVSEKPPNWTGKSNSEMDLVKGAELSDTSRIVVRRRVDLRYAEAYGAFLAKANLSGAHLEGADLRSSDLRQAKVYFEGPYLNDADLSKANLSGANLTRAELKDADLTKANLTEAELSGADMTNTILAGADLTFTNFKSSSTGNKTVGLTPAALKTAKNWDKAYYDADLLQQLGLPLDNNQKLAEEQKQQQTGPPAACPATATGR